MKKALVAPGLFFALTGFYQSNKDFTLDGSYLVFKGPDH
jgi:hypothetical protein